MSYGPQIPPAEREIFARPPLKAMLGQLRFPAVLRIHDPATLAGFQDAIRGDFPEFTSQQEFSVALGPSGPQEAKQSSAYRFSTADLRWAVQLSSDTMTLEVASGERYTNYDEFLGRFVFAWAAVLEHFEPSRITRQGLRYVDHLEGDRTPDAWREYINPQLLCSLSGPLGEGVDQAVSHVVYARESGHLSFRHGIVAAGPDQTKGYLLDFDCYDERSRDDTSVDTVKARFDEYHELQHAFFRWCVTDFALEEFRRES